MNYDRRTEHDFSVRLGFGFTSSDVVGDIFAVPVVVSKLFGKQAAALELGLGATYMHIGTVAAGSWLGTLWNVSLPEQYSPISGMFFSGVVGFRAVVPGTGLLARLTFLPVFAGVRKDVGFAFFPWGGLRLGWAFL